MPRFPTAARVNILSFYLETESLSPILTCLPGFWRWTISLTGGSWPPVHSWLLTQYSAANSVQSFLHPALSMINSSLHINKTLLKPKNPFLSSYWPWFLPFTASTLKEPSTLTVHNVLFSPIPSLILTLFPRSRLHVGDPPPPDIGTMPFSVTSSPHSALSRFPPTFWATP